jgi:hypothetical protein
MTVAFHSRGTLVKTEDNEANKGSSKGILILVSIFASVSPIRFIGVIRGRLQKLRGSLAGGALADKIGFLWLNTELRGCRETEWATM